MLPEDILLQIFSAEKQRLLGLLNNLFSFWLNFLPSLAVRLSKYELFVIAENRAVEFPPISSLGSDVGSTIR